MAQGRKEGAVIMKKKKLSRPILVIFIWLAIYAVFIGNAIKKNDIILGSVADVGTFMTTASVSVKEDWVGANIWLKQAIHGTDGIKYRYVVKTDCPSWDFETRYMTDEPISWIDETSAVEVIIYDARVYYEGTVYGSGQYFTVPILGDLSSESIPYEEWQQNLVKQAYQAYVTDKNGGRMWTLIGVVLIPFIPVLLWCLKKRLCI